MITAALVMGLIGAGMVSTGAYLQTAKNSKYNPNGIPSYNKARQKLMQHSKTTSTKEFEDYLRDASYLGYLNGDTHKDAMKAYSKLKSYDYDVGKLRNKERESLINMYDQLYKGDDNFRNEINKYYANLTDADKMAFLDSVISSSASVPAPAYLDTSFDNYQREVAPLKLWTNKELADYMNIDFDFDNILKDYEKAAQAKVDYSTWLSDLAANNSEREDAYNQTSYLDAIRNVKSDAIIKGMSNGARAAAEVVANKEAIKNKVNEQQKTATQRFETMNDSLLERAQAAINTRDTYQSLAKDLGTNVDALYNNDVARRGQDLLTNANLYAADETLRSNRMAQNNLMAAMYNAASAQSKATANSKEDPLWYFKNISMPANDYDFGKAINDYIDLGYTQATGYQDVFNKWGAGGR